MSFLFISYSRRDQEKVDRLADHLTARQIPFWIDRHGISGGDEWRRQIVEGIQKCSAFLLVLSRNSVASRNVRKEIDLAEHHSKRIIPVELEAIEIPDQLEYQLIGIQRIDLTGNMAAKWGPLDSVLLPYRQGTEGMAQASTAGRKSGRSPDLKRTVRFAGIYGLAGLAFAVGWILLLLVSNLQAFQAGFPGLDWVTFRVPGYLSGLYGQGFQSRLSIGELAMIYPLTWLIPGIVTGWLLPAFQPYKRLLSIWLGVVVAAGLVAELFFLINLQYFAVNYISGAFIWRGWIGMVIMVGGVLSTVVYAGRKFFQTRK